MTKVPTVFVVIPVFMRWEDTRNCVQQFLSQTYPNIHIIIADGGSKDGSVEKLKSEFPKLSWVIPKSGEWWWSGSMAFGIDRALELSNDPRDFILMMNNDTTFSSDFVEVLVRTSEENNRAAVGALTVDLESGAVLDAGVNLRWDPYYQFPVTTVVPVGQKWSSEINVLPGRGSLIPIEIIRKVGNINWQKLPHYIADYEFFIRAFKAGFPLLVSFETTLKSDTKVTGLFYNGENRLSLSRWWKLTTSRRSMTNVIDHLNFVSLAFPEEFKWRGFRQVIWGNISQLFSKTVPGRILRKIHRVIRHGLSQTVGWFFFEFCVRLRLYVLFGQTVRSMIPALNFTYAELEKLHLPAGHLKGLDVGIFEDANQRFYLGIKHYLRYRLGHLQPEDPRTPLIKRLAESKKFLNQGNISWKS
ncbi:MAG: glycosyltransferase [Bdellovibrionales bacterium]|nr:glycosyltransferase [Bdellovibrionales bacterium]